MYNYEEMRLLIKRLDINIILRLEYLYDAKLFYQPKILIINIFNNNEYESKISFKSEFSLSLSMSFSHLDNIELTNFCWAFCN